jgi:hypothetical protein
MPDDFELAELDDAGILTEPWPWRARRRELPAELPQPQEGSPT